MNTHVELLRYRSAPQNLHRKLRPNELCSPQSIYIVRTGFELLLQRIKIQDLVLLTVDVPESPTLGLPTNERCLPSLKLWPLATPRPRLLPFAASATECPTVGTVPTTNASAGFFGASGGFEGV